MESASEIEARRTRAALQLQATAWAMRRPSRDRRRPVVASATVDKTEKTCPEGLRSSWLPPFGPGVIEPPGLRSSQFSYIDTDACCSASAARPQLSASDLIG